MKRILILIFIGCLFVSCDSNKLEKIPMEKFIGIWELKGRTMFEGIKIEIKPSGNSELVGRIVHLNQNKYVNIFANINDIWVSEISRSSNYQFKITEKKIANELFALYGISSSTEFSGEFLDSNIIGLAKGTADPLKSDVQYHRVNE